MIALVWLAGMFAPLARAQSALLGYVAGEERGVVVGHGSSGSRLFCSLVATAT
jgi:hypothetical protein